MALVLDVGSDHILHTLPHDGAVNGVAWEPGNTGRLATASSDSSMRIWATDSSSRTTYKGHTGDVTAIAWGPTGLATGSIDTTIIVWNI